jgi:tetratricopeptide (TPR) repeat protein
MPYYEEALKRDPSNSRVNVALGIDYNKRAMYENAIEHLTRAVQRISYNYTRPRDCEAYYQLAVAQRATGDTDKAYENFYRAAWDHAFTAPAYYQLAELSCTKGDFPMALEQINSSLACNALNTKARNLKAAILRKLEKYDMAKTILAVTLEQDPIDFLALNELYLLENSFGSTNRAAGIVDDLTFKMRGETQSYMELAADYIGFGLNDDAIAVLLRAARLESSPASTYPMVYYYIGWLYGKNGDLESSKRAYAKAAALPPDFCFPFRSESITVLQAAVANDPEDARALYYLGNCLYDKQPEAAMTAWQKSAQSDDTFATVHRNLGCGHYRSENDIPAAIASYEKAIACNRQDPRVYAELDSLYIVGNIDPQKRVALLEKNHDVVAKRNDSYLHEIMALAQVGRYDDAIEYLTTNNWHVREGGGEIHDVYVDSYLLRGKGKLDAGDARAALADFTEAAKYPENLRVGRPQNDDRAAQVNYFIAVAHKALGDTDKAKGYFTLSAEQSRTNSWPQARYYQALSFAQLARKDKADEIFANLVETGNERLNRDEAADFFAKFGERQTAQARKAEAHYIFALGLLGQGKTAAAKDNLKQAADLNKNHIWAKFELSQLN